MRLLCDEERIPQQGAMLLGTLEQAAVLCLKEEGIPDKRVETVSPLFQWKRSIS